MFPGCHRMINVYHTIHRSANHEECVWDWHRCHLLTSQDVLSASHAAQLSACFCPACRPFLSDILSLVLCRKLPRAFESRLVRFFFGYRCHKFCSDKLFVVLPRTMVSKTFNCRPKSGHDRLDVQIVFKHPLLAHVMEICNYANCALLCDQCSNFLTSKNTLVFATHNTCVRLRLSSLRPRVRHKCNLCDSNFYIFSRLLLLIIVQ